MSMSAFPDLALQLSKQSSAASGAGMQTNFDVPFSFDNSGWNVASRSTGSQSATGSTGQGAGGGGAGLGDLFAGINTTMLLLGAAAYFLLRGR